MSKITDTVKALAAPVVVKHACELWGVEYVKEAGAWFLRVFIDRPEGISISHCEAVSRELDAILDLHDDLIPASYTFEVSSAGVERQLRGPSDFERFAGHYVEIKLYKAKDGRKIIRGELSAWDDDKIELDIEGQRVVFDNAEVASVRLRMRG